MLARHPHGLLAGVALSGRACDAQALARRGAGGQEAYRAARLATTRGNLAKCFE
jgi:hypothetical protein